MSYTWSARFTVIPLRRFEGIVRRLGCLARGFADAGLPISGAVLGAGEAEDRATIVLGLDPSRNFGTPSRDSCEEIAQKISAALGWRRQSKELPEMRVIMGRRIGYRGSEHSMRTVRGITVAHGCGRLALCEADLFSLRYIPDTGIRQYREPGVIVEGSVSDLNPLLNAAAELGQMRLVAEITGVATQVYSHVRGSMSIETLGLRTNNQQTGGQ